MVPVPRRNAITITRSAATDHIYHVTKASQYGTGCRVAGHVARHVQRKRDVEAPVRIEKGRRGNTRGCPKRIVAIIRTIERRSIVHFCFCKRAGGVHVLQHRAGEVCIDAPVCERQRLGASQARPSTLLVPEMLCASPTTCGRRSSGWQPHGLSAERSRQQSGEDAR